MSKQQRKLQKRKVREKEVRQHLLTKREKLLAPIREAKQDVLREKRIKKLQKDLEQFNQVMQDRELATASNDTLSQLEKNVQILRTLENEYNREMEQKSALNQELEEKGYFTLEEKMKAAQELLVKETNVGVGGSAECKVGPAKETAQVSVVKAPQNENTENS